MRDVKQNTTVSTLIGPILDSEGAEYNDAVIGDISQSVNGADEVPLAAPSTLIAQGNGKYRLTHLVSTLGSVDFTCNKSTYQMSIKELMVLREDTYEAMYEEGPQTLEQIAAAVRNRFRRS